MGQSLVQVYLHIVFSTKSRKPFLKDELFQSDLHGYLAGACQNLDSPSIQIGGVEDHVHILCQFSKTHSIADTVRDLKRESSKWVKDQQPKLNEFQWQNGYGAFSVSPSHVDALKEYIRNQRDHHRKESFQDEFRRLCRKYGIELDERYVWE
ncbi:MAG: IS200/IS605 family transposase [Planctomycetota bacterium]|nr:IS200/IS605 family transposase [Planctomycetota bacterium]MDA0921213.1 IS200/IS605 family transposase [Planctomycetota bacterium]MDA1158257.1 IS200/IS605 family transposase [Planctomycetota bacterium]